MSWAVRLTRRARKQLDAIRGPDLARLRDAILALETDPRASGAVPLRGSPYHRLRVGDWRIIYEILPGRIVMIAVVVRRSERTYRRLE